MDYKERACVRFVARAFDRNPNGITCLPNVKRVYPDVICRQSRAKMYQALPQPFCEVKGHARIVCARRGRELYDTKQTRPSPRVYREWVWLRQTKASADGVAPSSSEGCTFGVGHSESMDVASKN